MATGEQLLWLSHALRDSGFSFCTTQCVSSTWSPVTEDTQVTSRSSKPYDTIRIKNSVVFTPDHACAYFSTFGRTFFPLVRAPRNAHRSDAHFDAFRLVFVLTKRPVNRLTGDRVHAIQHSSSLAVSTRSRTLWTKGKICTYSGVLIIRTTKFLHKFIYRFQFYCSLCLF